MTNTEYEKWKEGLAPQRYDGLPVTAVRVDATNGDAVVTWLADNGVEAVHTDETISFGHTTADPGNWVVLTETKRVRVMDDASFTEIYDVHSPPLAGA